MSPFFERGWWAGFHSEWSLNGTERPPADGPRTMGGATSFTSTCTRPGCAGTSRRIKRIGCGRPRGDCEWKGAAPKGAKRGFAGWHFSAKLRRCLSGLYGGSWLRGFCERRPCVGRAAGSTWSCREPDSSNSVALGNYYASWGRAAAKCLSHMWGGGNTDWSQSAFKRPCGLRWLRFWPARD
jgi:hypothetical protein